MKGPKGKYAWSARVGEKGQIVIPKEARDVFGISPGETILILGDEKKGLAIVKSSKFADLLALVLGAESGDETDAGGEMKE